MYTRCVLAAQMLHVFESETDRSGPKCGEAIDLCWGYHVRGLSLTHATLNAVLSVPTLAFSSTFFPTCYSMCESFDSLLLSITTPWDKSAYEIHAWSSSQAACCPRLRRHWKWENILIFFSDKAEIERQNIFFLKLTKCLFRKACYYISDSFYKNMLQQKCTSLACELQFLEMFPVIISIFLLHMTYRQIHR